MSCPQSLMNQGHKCLRLLPAVTRYRIDETGTLVLSIEDGTRVVPRPYGDDRCSDAAGTPLGSIHLYEVDESALNVGRNKLDSKFLAHVQVRMPADQHALDRGR